MSMTNQIADSLEKSGIPFVRVEGVADGTEYWGLTVFHENVHAEVRECADWVETKVWNCTPEQFMNMLVGAGTCKLVIEKRRRHGPLIYHFGCGYDFWQPTDCPMPILKHCPNCGKRIEEMSE